MQVPLKEVITLIVLSVSGTVYVHAFFTPNSKFEKLERKVEAIETNFRKQLLVSCLIADKSNVDKKNLDRYCKIDDLL